MRIFQIVLLSILPYGFLQTGDIFKAIESNNKKDITKWLKADSDFNVLNEQGQTVVIAAVKVGNKKLIKQLLKKKIDVNLLDYSGKTALDHAIELKKINIILYLVTKKAKVTNESNLAKVRDLVVKQCKKMYIISSVFLFLALGCVFIASFAIECALFLDSFVCAGLIFVVVSLPFSLFASYWAKDADVYLPSCYQINKKNQSRLLIPIDQKVD